MDVQQRMWIFGGLADDYGHGPTVKPACVLWRLLWVRPVGQRASKRSVTFVIAAIWSWGTRSWNDLRYFETQAMLLFGESCFSKIVVCWVSFKCHHFLLVVVGLSPIGMLIQRVWCANGEQSWCLLRCCLEQCGKNHSTRRPDWIHMCMLLPSLKCGEFTGSTPCAKHISPNRKYLIFWDFAWQSSPSRYVWR
jgi:hypothetical protein